MKLELYKKVAERYAQIVRDREHESRQGPFSDVAGNLVVCMGSLVWSMERNGVDSESKKDFMRQRSALKLYLQLIERHPDFGDAEIKLEEGYFPDIRAYVYGPEGIKERKKTGEDSVHKHYVALCKSRLERNL